MSDIESDFYYKAVRVLERKFKVKLQTQLTSIGHGDSKHYLYSIDVLRGPFDMCPWVRTRAEALLNAWVKILNPGKTIHKMTRKEKYNAIS